MPKLKEMVQKYGKDNNKCERALITAWHKSS